MTTRKMKIRTDINGRKNDINIREKRLIDETFQLVICTSIISMNMHSSEHYYSSLLLVATNIMVIYVYTYVHVKDNRQKVETKSKLTGEIIIQQKWRKDEVIL